MLTCFCVFLECGHACLPIILAQELVHHAQIPGIFFNIYIYKKILTRVKKYLEIKKKTTPKALVSFLKGFPFFYTKYL